MKKVKLSFSTYGTHKHPVIRINVDGSIEEKFIFLTLKDAMCTLEQVVAQYLENGFTVEFVK